MDYFKSDLSLFSMTVTHLLKLKSFSPIREALLAKHLEETDAGRRRQDKANDLLIWNAVLCREVTKLGIYKGTLHTLYNRFYDLIPRAESLEALQDMEVDMFEAYIKGMVHDTETTAHHSVNKILQYIHMNIENHVSLSHIAIGVRLSEGYVSKAFQKVMGLSVMSYVKSVKIERARCYLLQNRYTVSELADLLGFCDTSHFVKVFKKQCGLTPMEYRLSRDEASHD